MGYDTRPLQTLTEKSYFLNLYDRDFILFLQHDSKNECCKLKKTDKGIRLESTYKLSDFL